MTLRIPSQWRRGGALVGAVSLFLALTGPYGATEGLPFWGALGYWLALILSGWVFGAGARAALWRIGAGWPPLAREGLSALAITAGVTPLVLVAHALMGQPTPVASWPWVAGMVGVIVLAMTGIGHLMSRARQAAQPSAPAADPAAAFLDRLGPRFRGAELWAIEAQDHYLRVLTDRGAAMILYRLTDAERDLSQADGLRVHRSWWVARAGVAEMARENGRRVIVLHDGGQAPVSRTYAQAVKASGWG